MIKYLKQEIKHLPVIMIVFVLLYGITTLASSYAIGSSDIEFDNTGTGIQSTDVQGAVNEVFQHATDYNELKTSVGALNSKLTKNPVQDASFTDATTAQLNADGSRVIESITFPAGDTVYAISACFDALGAINGGRVDVSLVNTSTTKGFIMYDGPASTSNFIAGSATMFAKGGQTVNVALYTNDVNMLASFRCFMEYVQLR